MTVSIATPSTDPYSVGCSIQRSARCAMSFERQTSWMGERLHCTSSISARIM